MGLQRDDDKDEAFQKLKAAVEEFFAARAGQDALVSEFVLVAQGSGFSADGADVRTVFENKGATTTCIGINAYADRVLGAYLDNIVFPEDEDEQ